MHHIQLFGRLGREIEHILTHSPNELKALTKKAVEKNGWFTQENIRYALQAIRHEMLDEEKLVRWHSDYPALKYIQPKNIGIIMAGNLPLVGFHDLLCTVVAGYRCFYKPSSKDTVLTDFIVDRMRSIDPAVPLYKWDHKSPLDALIATGSDNSNRYFRSAFPDIPKLLRGNRFSIAVLHGEETEAELNGLAQDIFRYFGLGCRNISRLFVPKNYEFSRIISALKHHRIEHPKFINGYRRHRSILQMRNSPFFDGDFFTLREHNGVSESLSDILFSHYKSLDDMARWIEQNDQRIQCIVSSDSGYPRGVPFGNTQRPGLWDYADGKDTIDFLTSISEAVPKDIRK